MHMRFEKKLVQFACNQIGIYNLPIHFPLGRAEPVHCNFDLLFRLAFLLGLLLLQILKTRTIAREKPVFSTRAHKFVTSNSHEIHMEELCLYCKDVLPQLFCVSLTNTWALNNRGMRMPHDPVKNSLKEFLTGCGIFLGCQVFKKMSSKNDNMDFL